MNSLKSKNALLKNPASQDTKMLDTVIWVRKLQQIDKKLNNTIISEFEFNVNSNQYTVDYVFRRWDNIPSFPRLNRWDLRVYISVGIIFLLSHV